MGGGAPSLLKTLQGLKRDFGKDLPTYPALGERMSSLFLDRSLLILPPTFKRTVFWLSYALCVYDSRNNDKMEFYWHTVKE